MSPVRVGIDIIEVDRIRRATERWPKLSQRVFTEEELAYCRAKHRPAEHLAARFAAKEAVMKALGRGIAEGTRFRDIEVAHDEHGRPIVVLHGELSAWTRERGLSSLEVSLSHTSGLAVAGVVSAWE